MWEISVADQSVTFLLSAALGALLCLFYDVFRSLRGVKKYSPVAVFFQDVLFFTLSAFITFFFLLATTVGVLRGYVLVGMLLGAVLMRLTLSRLFYALLSFVFALMLRYLRAFRGEFYRAGEVVLTFCLEIFIKTANTAKKIPFLLKKGLKHTGQVVYTNTEEKEKE